MGKTGKPVSYRGGGEGGGGAEGGNNICSEINKVLYRAQRRREEKIVCSDALT